MSYRQIRKQDVVFWIGIYVVLVLAPLPLALIGHEPASRGFWIEFGVGLGFVGLAIMGLQFLLTARFRSIARLIGTDSMLQFHRQAGLVSYGFILAHVVILLSANRQFVAFLDPLVNLPRAAALAGVLALLTALLVTTLWRQQLGIVYRWWRVTHGVMAMVVLLIGLAHILQVGFYIDVLWKQGVWVLLTFGALGLLLQVRLVKPMWMARRPYRVAAVRQEAPRVWTLELDPVGHKGLSFRAGQFAWLTLSSSPFTMEQHPFSLSSSDAAPGGCSMTIKALGDFTSRIGQVAVGRRAFLEGPYGAFGLSNEASGAVMIAGGIGITPIMSILRSMDDRHDSRPTWLIYGVADEQQLVFREELERLCNHISLKVRFMVEQPSDQWQGLRGRITPQFLLEHCPKEVPGLEYLICGPDPMMDIAEQTFRSWSIPWHRIRSERFSIA